MGRGRVGWLALVSTQDGARGVKATGNVAGGTRGESECRCKNYTLSSKLWGESGGSKE